MSTTPRRAYRPALLLTALLGGMFLGNVDIAIVNIATPSIRETLHTSDGELAFIVSGYTLAYSLLLITSARLGDMRGYRKMYLLGLLVFGLSSLACGLAPTPMALVSARVVQGVGAALMASQVLIGIQLNFEGAARARALGLYTAVLSISAVIGQSLGGVLVSADLFHTAWRPIFLINVPIGIFLIVFTLLYVPADGQRKAQRVDHVGMATLSTALLLLVVPLVLGRDAGWPAWSWICLVGSVPVFALFVMVERRLADRGGYPLISLSLLRRPPVALGLISQAATRATYFAILFVVALYLQQGLGKSPLYSGLAVVPWVAAFGITGPLLGRVPPRVRRLAAPAGALVLAASFMGIALSVRADAADGVALLVLLGIGGLGYGAAFSATLSHLTNAVTNDRHAADMSGLFNTTLQIGGVLGVAVFGTTYLNLVTGAGAARAEHGFTVVTLALAATGLAAAVLAQLAVRDRAERHSPQPQTT
jgi:EmrB/QacA subfamily drug resistance transporter